jgi:hypothetical protein
MVGLKYFFSGILHMSSLTQECRIIAKERHRIGPQHFDVEKSKGMGQNIRTKGGEHPGLLIVHNW